MGEAAAAAFTAATEGAAGAEVDDFFLLQVFDEDLAVVAAVLEGFADEVEELLEEPVVDPETKEAMAGPGKVYLALVSKILNEEG